MLNYSRALCGQIQQSFVEFFHEAGFHSWAAEPLVPSHDNSVLFTNASICGLKGFFADPGALRGHASMVVVQPCLRFHNLLRDYVSKESLPYLSYFTMLGGLVEPAKLERLLSEFARFLTNVDGIDWQRLLVRSSHSQVLFNRSLEFLQDGSAAPLPLEFDSRSPRYYRWQYGSKGITGNGITLALLQRDDSYQDFGNIVEIRKEGEVLGYEFGFGVETLGARILNLRTPLECSGIDMLLSTHRGQEFDLIKDQVLAALMMINAGVTWGSRGRSAILRKTIKKISEGIDYRVVTAEMVSRLITEAGRFYRLDEAVRFHLQYCLSQTIQRKMVCPVKIAG